MDPLVLYTICSAYRLPIPEGTIKMIRIPSQTFGFFITVELENQRFSNLRD